MSSIKQKAFAHFEKHCRYHGDFTPPIYICGYGRKKFQADRTDKIVAMIEQEMWAERRTNHDVPRGTLQCKTA